MNVEKEAQARSELVHVEVGVDRRLNVGQPVGEGEGDLLHCVGAGLADVVAADGDGVPAGDFFGAEAKHICDQSHGRPRGVHVRPSRDVLLEDVVLNGPSELSSAHSLGICDGDVEREQRRRSGVDGHRG